MLLIRPHLEYAIPAWNSSLQRDIDNLENVQQKATRLVPGMKKKRYLDRLKALKLTTLETRRKRGDLTEFYKILNGLESVSWKNGFVKTHQGNADGPSSNLRRK